MTTNLNTSSLNLIHQETHKSSDPKNSWFSKQNLKNIKDSINRRLDALEDSTIDDVYQAVSVVLNIASQHIAQKSFKAVFPHATQKQVDAFETSETIKSIKKNLKEKVPHYVKNAATIHIATNLAQIYPGTSVGYSTGKDLSQYLLPQQEDRAIFGRTRKFTRIAMTATATFLGASADAIIPFKEVFGGFGSYILKTGATIAAKRAVLQHTGKIDPLKTKSSHFNTTSFISRNICAQLAKSGSEYLYSMIPFQLGTLGKSLGSAVNYGAYYAAYHHDLTKKAVSLLLEEAAHPK